MADDLVGTVTDILLGEGQTVNGVLVADQAEAAQEKATPTDIISQILARQLLAMLSPPAIRFTVGDHWYRRVRRHCYPLPAG